MPLIRLVCSALVVCLAAGLAVGADDDVKDAPALELIPRKALIKRDVLVDQEGSRLIVKFRDDLKARADGKGSLAFNGAVAAAAAEQEITMLVEEMGVYFQQAINKTPEALRELEKRAEVYSGKAQPDLAGMMYVECPQHLRKAVGDYLLTHETTEWVEFSGPMSTGYGGGPDPACGVGMQDCFLIQGYVAPFCEDPVCCQLVGSIRPLCVDEDFGAWDAYCAALAHLVCASPPADRCASFLAGTCYDDHDEPGCNNSTCCGIVCDIDDFCCGGADGNSGVWDNICQALATENCLSDQTGTSPDLVPLQAYLRSVSWEDQPGGVPVDPPVVAPFPPVAGLTEFTGEGMNLFSRNWIEDDPDSEDLANLYEGLYGFSRELFDVYEVGLTDPPGSDDRDDMIYNARGRGIKIGIVEWACWEDHEDLDITIEPGQTMLLTDEFEPHHGTAAAGIAGAKDNGIGINGVAPESELYFFPISSVEEGGRPLTAMANAFEMFAPGDVMSFSFGPGGCNLETSSDYWTMFRLGADLGIVQCMSAGNDCSDVDNCFDPGDGAPSGALTVGACFPGTPFCRIGFSNHHTDGDGIDIDVTGWGINIATCGYGAVWFGDGDPDKSYTNDFGGTSGACPMVAGYVACLQGLAMQFYNTPIPADGMVSHVGTWIFPQCGVPVPLQPGTPNGFECFGDFDPDEDANLVGGFPRTRQAAERLLITEFFEGGPGNMDGVRVLKGDHLFGNAFSIGAIDGQYLAIRSVFTRSGEKPDVGPPLTGGLGTPGGPGGDAGPFSRVAYIATGQITDIGALTVQDVSGSPFLNITLEAQPSTSGIARLAFIQLYNWGSRRWFYVSFGDLMDPTYGVPQPNGNIRVGDQATESFHYVHPQNDQILFRMWTFGFGTGLLDGFGSGGVDSEEARYIQAYDWIDISPSQQFGNNL